jgi:hypothetical protein
MRFQIWIWLTIKNDADLYENERYLIIFYKISIL